MSKFLGIYISSNIMAVNNYDNHIVENGSSMNEKLYFSFRTVVLRSQG